MPTKKKVEIVNQLADMISRGTIAIATDYRGLSVSEMSQLRSRLRELGIEYRVVKNTLCRFAAEKAGKPALSSIVDGPTAIAFGYGDVAEPARALANYLRSSKTTLSIKGGLLGEQVLSIAEVTTLSGLPSKDVLISKLLAGMQAPIAALLNTLTASMQGLIVVLQARVKQMEGG